LTTAIIGVGNIGSPLARHLVGGGEAVILAAKDKARADALAQELGPLARAASTEDAIAGADVVVFAVWLNTIKELMVKHARLLEDKIVVDPSNPLAFDDGGQMTRTLPAEQSAGAMLARLLPPEAHYAKAFGTLGADSLAEGANRRPRRAVLFYASDDDAAAAAVERLISAAGFDPVKAGGVADALRIEAPGGDLHQHGGLNGRLLDIHEAQEAVAATGGLIPSTEAALVTTGAGRNQKGATRKVGPSSERDRD
jgi:predicted dinucleotide-binding enzyme